MLVRHAKRLFVIFALLGVAMLAAAPAISQTIQRPIPDETKRATIAYVSGMMVAINGRQILLSPAVQIRDQSNRIIVPSALPPGESVADYLLDFNGQVSRVWLLTPQEAARKKAVPAKP
jgi:hypothetical protein